MHTTNAPCCHWTRYSLNNIYGTVLERFSLYGTRKWHGWGTVLFLSSVMISVHYNYMQLTEPEEAYRLIRKHYTNLSVEVLCHASGSCNFFQVGGDDCSVSQRLGFGEIIEITESETCTWIIEVYTNLSYVSRIAALALIFNSSSPTDISNQYFPVLESHFIQHIDLAMKLDETYDPPLTEWNVIRGSNLSYNISCLDDALVCGAYQLRFDPKVEVISSKRELTLFISEYKTSQGIVVFYLWIWMLMRCIDFIVELDKEFGKKSN